MNEFLQFLLAGLVIGPPVVLLTAAALILGFLLLLTAAVCPLVAPLFAGLTGLSLGWCERLVDLGDRLPPGHFYVPDIPGWWVAGFYALLALGLLPRAWRPRIRTAAPLAAGWLCVGLAVLLVRLPTNELRVTFLAVGHGGCTVLETPDGRVLLYDAGSLRGPGVARHQIAPFLWSRGVRRMGWAAAGEAAARPLHRGCPHPPRRLRRRSAPRPSSRLRRPGSPRRRARRRPSRGAGRAAPSAPGRVPWVHRTGTGRTRVRPRCRRRSGPSGRPASPRGIPAAGTRRR